MQGKAAIDVICNPLGKSGGALIQQFMIIGFGSLAASTPYLGAILLAIVLIWIQVRVLGGRARTQVACCQCVHAAGTQKWCIYAQ